MFDKQEKAKISQTRMNLPCPACQNTGAAAIANWVRKQLTNQTFWERWTATTHLVFLL